MEKFFFTLAVLLVLNPVQGEIFKWTDDQGNVHYGDKPAENSQQLQINEESSAASRLTREQREERRRKLLEAFDEDREKANREKAKQEKQKARIQKNCIYAKDRLKRYRVAGSLYRLDKDGNRVFMSEGEKQASVDRLQAEIDKYCN